MTSRRLVAVLVAGLTLATPAFAAEVEEDSLDRRVLDISRDLRCTVCQNQPISESNAELAQDMRNIVREQLQAGKSRKEIMQYFVDRYGNYVLMKPPTTGSGAALWTLPAVLAAVFAASAFVYLRRRRHRPVSAPPTLTPDDLERVRKAREQDAP